MKHNLDALSPLHMQLKHGIVLAKNRLSLDNAAGQAYLTHCPKSLIVQ